MILEQCSGAQLVCCSTIARWGCIFLLRFQFSYETQLLLQDCVLKIRHFYCIPLSFNLDLPAGFYNYILNPQTIMPSNAGEGPQKVYQSHQAATSKNQKVKGRWSKVEQLKYYLFLSHHKKRFAQNEIRRSLRMFKHMSVFIKSRNANQCRIRHIKTLKKYGGIDECLQNYISNSPQFAQNYEKVKPYLQILEDRAYCGDFQNYQELDKPSPVPTSLQEDNKSKNGNEMATPQIPNKPVENEQAGLQIGYESTAMQKQLFYFYWQQMAGLHPIFYYT